MNSSNFVSRALVGLMFLSTGLAFAESRGSSVPLLPKYEQECAACHVAYPAGMLPARSWQRLMGNLTSHFGTDASLDEASVREIDSWLSANAGTFRRVSAEPPQDRITTSAWFVRQHHEVQASVWKRASIGSASNCAACHGGAAKGDFNEDHVRIPR